MKDLFKRLLKDNTIFSLNELKCLQPELRVVYYFAGKLCKNQKIMKDGWKRFYQSEEGIAKYLEISRSTVSKTVRKHSNLFYRCGKERSKYKDDWKINKDVYTEESTLTKNKESEFYETLKKMEDNVKKSRREERREKIKKELNNDKLLIEENNWDEEFKMSEKNNITIIKTAPEGWEQEFKESVDTSVKSFGRPCIDISTYLYSAFDHSNIEYDSSDYKTNDFVYNDEFRTSCGNNYNSNLIKKACIDYVTYLFNKKVIVTYDTWLKNFVNWSYENLKIEKKSEVDSNKEYWDNKQKIIAEEYYLSFN